MNEWSLLGGDASRLPDEKLLQIYRLLEPVGEKAEIAAALAAMRPRLTRLRPQRRPSLLRLFFRPVEDLMDDPDGYNRKLNRVSRAILLPCWRAVKDRIGEEVTGPLLRDLPHANLQDGQAMATLCAPFWRAGVVVMDAVLAECEADLKRKVQLFGRDADVQRQLGTVRQILSIAVPIEALKAALPPRPIQEMAPSHIDKIRQTLTALGQEDARAVAPLLMVLASRMQRPGDLLRLLADVKLGGTVHEKEALTRDMSGYVVGNLLRQSADFEREQQDKPGDLESMSRVAERLTDGLNSVADIVLSLRDKDVVQKMGQARAEIGHLLLRKVGNGTDTALMAALFAGDGQGIASDEDMRRAEQLALALRRSFKLALHLGIQKEIGTRIGEARRQLEVRTQAMLHQIPRTREGRLAPAAERQMVNSLRVVEILAGSDEAERLSREWRRQFR